MHGEKIKNIKLGFGEFLLYPLPIYGVTRLSKDSVTYWQLLNKYQNRLALLLNKCTVIVVCSSLLPRSTHFSMLMTHIQGRYVQDIHCRTQLHYCMLIKLLTSFMVLTFLHFTQNVGQQRSVNFLLAVMYVSVTFKIRHCKINICLYSRDMTLHVSQSFNKA